MVTFIPPPVEPGPAPTSMNTIVKSVPPELISLCGTVANPAVLGVTAAKIEAKMRSPAVISAIVWPFSKKKNKNRATDYKNAGVAVIISFECR